jgi:hypothetical protein
MALSGRKRFISSCGQAAAAFPASNRFQLERAGIMTATLERQSQVLDISVRYGIVGAGCSAQIPRNEAAGLTARQLVESVLERQSGNGSSSWIGRVLGEVLESRRDVDVELHFGPRTETAGAPIGIQDVIELPLPESEDAQPSRVTISLSESYRGGAHGARKMSFFSTRSAAIRCTA